MALSMTGLGLGEVRYKNRMIIIELRSVNNRFLDISCRMPSSLTIYEREVRELIRNYMLLLQFRAKPMEN